MSKIRIPSPLRPYTDGKSEIEIHGHNVGEALDDLTQQYPKLRQHLYTGQGDLRSFVNVFLNDEDIRYLQGVETPLADNASLMIVPSVAGGSA